MRPLKTAGFNERAFADDRVLVSSVDRLIEDMVLLHLSDVFERGGLPEVTQSSFQTTPFCAFFFAQGSRLTPHFGLHSHEHASWANASP